MDRSIYGDVIFAKLLRDNNEMSQSEFAIYMELLANMLDHIEAPKLMVYLKIDTDSAIERIKEIVPIWKKEHWEDGEEWMGNQLETVAYPSGKPEEADLNE